MRTPEAGDKLCQARQESDTPSALHEQMLCAGCGLEGHYPGGCRSHVSLPRGGMDRRSFVGSDWQGACSQGVLSSSSSWGN